MWCLAACLELAARVYSILSEQTLFDVVMGSWVPGEMYPPYCRISVQMIVLERLIVLQHSSREHAAFFFLAWPVFVHAF